MSSVKTWSSLQELIGLEHGNEDFILPPYVLPHLCISAALSENARVWLALAQLFYDPLVHHYQGRRCKIPCLGQHYKNNVLSCVFLFETESSL